MWFYITDDRREAERIVVERLAPVIHRPVEHLRERLPIGPAEAFADLLDEYRAAGVHTTYVWPVADEANQLRLFSKRVAPLVQ